MAFQLDEKEKVPEAQTHINSLNILSVDESRVEIN